MAHSFIARADDRFMCHLEAEERAIIEQVAGEVTDLIRADLGLGEHDLELGVSAADFESDDPLTRLAAETRNERVHDEPRDPATRRLFPAASTDREEAAEFRRYAQRSLAEGHIDNLSTIRAAVDVYGELSDPSVSSEIVLTRGEAYAWLKGLNAIRLVLGERMGLKNDGDFEALQLLCSNDLEEDDDLENGVAGPGFLVSLYEFLSWLQESLIGALNSRP